MHGLMYVYMYIDTEWSEGSSPAIGLGVAEPVSWGHNHSHPEPVLHCQGLSRPPQDIRQVQIHFPCLGSEEQI